MLKGLLKILMCFFSKQENNQAGTHNFDKTFESNVFILFFWACNTKYFSYYLIELYRMGKNDCTTLQATCRYFSLVIM